MDWTERSNRFIQTKQRSSEVNLKRRNIKEVKSYHPTSNKCYYMSARFFEILNVSIIRVLVQFIFVK